jgi:hypothetical protein
VGLRELCNRALRVIGGQEELQVTAFGVAVFATINIPSLKLFAGASMLVNLAVLVLVLFAGIGRALHQGSWRLPRERLLLSAGLLTITVLTVAPEILALRRPSVLFLTGFGQLLFLWAITTAVSVFATRDDVRTYVTAQLLWGATMGALVLAGIVRYTELEDRAFHYNTVALPIALGAVVGVSLWLGARAPRCLAARLCTAGALLVCALALLQLPSRVSLLGVPAVCLLGLGLSVVWGGPAAGLRRRALRSAAVLTTLVVVAAIIYTQTGASRLLIHRTARLLQAGASESRAQYMPATVAAIARNPLGYGLNQFVNLTYDWSPYPHNLVLDAFFSGGWAVGMLYSCLLVWGSIRLLGLYRREHSPLVLTVGLMAAYLLLAHSVAQSWLYTYGLLSLFASNYTLRQEPQTGGLAPAGRVGERANA